MLQFSLTTILGGQSQQRTPTVSIRLSKEPYHGRWPMWCEDANGAENRGTAAVNATFGDSVAEKPPSGVSETMRVESNTRSAGISW